MVENKENNNTEKKTVVIIIGNGFDIANNFKTSYSEFVKSEYFNNLIEAKNSLAIHIKGVYTLYNWVDVELEIGKYSFNLENKTAPHELEKVNRVFEEEFIELKRALYKYIQSMNSNKTNPKMEKLVDDWKNYTMPDYNTNLFIVTFNYHYWDTIKFLENLITENVIGKSPLHIHGKTDFSLEDSTEIVLGVENNGLRGKSHNFIVKAFDRNIRAPEYFRTIKNATKFIIFGCSIVGTDIRYFKPIFDKATNKEFLIYGYGRKGLTDVQYNISQLCDFDRFITENEVKFEDSSQFS